MDVEEKRVFLYLSPISHVVERWKMRTSSMFYIRSRLIKDAHHTVN